MLTQGPEPPEWLVTTWILILLAGQLIVAFWLRDIWALYLWAGAWIAVRIAYESPAFRRWWKGEQRPHARHRDGRGR